MRPARPAIAILALSLAAPACLPSQADLQRDYAASLRPARVRGTAAEAPAVTRTLKIRAYADAGYRGHAADWEQRIAAQVRGASEVVERDFAVRLELEAIRPWERAGPASDLDPLDALADHDPAGEVDWVVGFVAPVPEDSSREHAYLGRATSFGRHFVLRAMVSPAEIARIGVVWDELTEEEQAAMVGERRVHREISVFLHEWGHTLGAAHECDDKWIMSSRYSVLNAAFSPESARLIRVGLAHRDVPEQERIARWAPAWRAEAVRMQGAAWECAKLEEGLAKQEAFLARALRRAALHRYAKAVDEAVRRRLKCPDEPAPAPEPTPLRVEVRLDPAGAVRALKLLASSSVPGFDETALAAVRAAGPFPPPPAELVTRTGEVVVELVVRLR